jgi:hypothetical protein
MGRMVLARDSGHARAIQTVSACGIHLQPSDRFKVCSRESCRPHRVRRGTDPGPQPVPDWPLADGPPPIRRPSSVEGRPAHPLDESPPPDTLSLLPARAEASIRPH